MNAFFGARIVSKILIIFGAMGISQSEEGMKVLTLATKQLLGMSVATWTGMANRWNAGKKDEIMDEIKTMQVFQAVKEQRPEEVNFLLKVVDEMDKIPEMKLEGDSLKIYDPYTGDELFNVENLDEYRIEKAPEEFSE